MTATALKTMTIECPRCCGRGYMDEFAHVANGRCFLCGGAKTIDLRDAVDSEKADVKVMLQVRKSFNGEGLDGQVFVYRPKGEMIETRPNGSKRRIPVRMPVWIHPMTDINECRELWKAWKGTRAELEVWQYTDPYHCRGKHITYQA